MISNPLRAGIYPRMQQQEVVGLFRERRSPEMQQGKRLERFRIQPM
jgi:hypothetical protein